MRALVGLVLILVACSSTGTLEPDGAALEDAGELGTEMGKGVPDALQADDVAGDVAGDAAAMCDEVTSGGCAAPLRCAFRCASAWSCFAAGGVLEGGACSPDLDDSMCARGLGCVAGVCRRYCHLAMDCKADQMCKALFSVPDAGCTRAGHRVCVDP